MSHNTAFTLITLLQCLAVISAIVGAIHLAKNRVDGWVWFLVLAFIISPTTIKLDNDPQTKECKIESN